MLLSDLITIGVSLVSPLVAFAGEMGLQRGQEEQMVTMVQALKEQSGLEFLIVCGDEVPEFEPVTSADDLPSILNRIGQQLDWGWEMLPKGVVVLSERLRPLTWDEVLEMEGMHIQDDRLYGLAALPELMALIGDEGKQTLLAGERLVFHEGEPAYNLVDTMAQLCPTPDSLIRQTRSCDLRLFADPTVSFYAEPTRVPGFVPVLYPRLYPQWHRWTGDADRSPLFTVKQILKELGHLEKLTLNVYQWISLDEVATHLQRATGGEWQFDRRLQTLRILLTRSEWDVKGFLEVLTKALHAGIRQVKDLMFVYAQRYEGFVHRWLDEQMIPLLEPLFAQCLEHGQLCPDYLMMRGYRTGELPPVVRFTPFHKEDFLEGRPFTWEQLTEEQRQFFEQILPPEWHQWVGPEEVESTQVRCLPGIIVTIQRFSNLEAQGEPLRVCSIPFH